jgi:hypothetical protein
VDALFSYRVPLMLIREIKVFFNLKNPGEKIKLLETPKAYSTKQFL